MGTWFELLQEARRRAGLTQLELARRSGTSRPTLSAYEHGHKAPTADTMERVLAAAGMELVAQPVVRWSEVAAGRGHRFWVPDRLWRLDSRCAFAEVVLPLELHWSAPGRPFALRDRRQRARLYEVLLREGQPADLQRWVDGVLLVDVWPDLVLPRALRAAWQPVIDAALPGESSGTGTMTLGAAS